MKRYKLTRDFGTFKAGQEFEDNVEYIRAIVGDYSDKDCNTMLDINIDQIPTFIEQGIIEEIKEKIWTDDDMVEFARDYNRGRMNIEQKLQNFKKEREYYELTRLTRNQI